MIRMVRLIVWGHFLQPAWWMLGESWRLARRHWRACCVHVAITVVACLIALPFDAMLVEMLGSKHPQAPLTEAAKEISHYGKFEVGTLALFAVVMLAGIIRRRRAWRHAAIAILLAATLAGLTANVFRPTIGRSRPSTTGPQGIYGPSMSTKYQSFPSAHAATAGATGVAAVAALGPVAIPVLAVALVVAWSRLHLRRHHLSDVLAGLAIGGLFGVLVGRSSRLTAARGDAEPPDDSTSP